MHAIIQISEPWDFPCNKPLSAVVIKSEPLEMLLRLEQPVEYERRVFRSARVNPRHVGAFFRHDGVPTPANIVLMEGVDDVGKSNDFDHIFVVGSVLLA